MDDVLRKDTEAESVKNMVILLDRSPSMTGLKKDLAKHVVFTILETLSEEDFVTVLAFSDQTSPVVENLDVDVDPETVQVITLKMSSFFAHLNIRNGV